MSIYKKYNVLYVLYDNNINVYNIETGELLYEFNFNHITKYKGVSIKCVESNSMIIIGHVNGYVSKWSIDLSFLSISLPMKNNNQISMIEYETKYYYIVSKNKVYMISINDDKIIFIFKTKSYITHMNIISIDDNIKGMITSNISGDFDMFDICLYKKIDTIHIDTSIRTFASLSSLYYVSNKNKSHIEFIKHIN